MSGKETQMDMRSFHTIRGYAVQDNKDGLHHCQLHHRHDFYHSEEQVQQHSSEPKAYGETRLLNLKSDTLFISIHWSDHRSEMDLALEVSDFVCIS